MSRLGEDGTQLSDIRADREDRPAHALASRENPPSWQWQLRACRLSITWYVLILYSMQRAKGHPGTIRRDSTPRALPTSQTRIASLRKWNRNGGNEKWNGRKVNHCIAKRKFRVPVHCQQFSRSKLPDSAPPVGQVGLPNVLEET